MFFSLHSQWRWVGVGMAGLVRTGLDYAAIDPTARALGYAVTPRMMLDVQVMEREALKVWSKRR